MKMPLHITIDLEIGTPLVYVCYVQPHEAFRPNSRRINESIVVDTDASGGLVGLELLDLSAETLVTARILATKYGAAFPDYLNPAKEAV